MAAALTSLFTPVDGGAAQTITSPSFTPTPGTLLIVFTVTTGSASSTGSGTMSSTIPGMTDPAAWSKQQWNPTGSAKTGCSAYWMIVPSGASAGTVSVTFSAAPASGRLSAFVPTGITVNTADPVRGVIANGYDTTGTLALTLTEAPAAADLVFGGFGSRNNKASSTVSAPYTKVVESVGTANPTADLYVEQATGITSTTVSMSGLNTVDNSGIALIVKASAGAPPAQGSAAGAFRFAATAAGRAVLAGAAAGAFAFTGAAAGTSTRAGTAASSSSWAGSAAGTTTAQGSATGATGWAGTAQGVTPAVGVNSGAGSGAFTFAGAATGATTTSGAASGASTWTGAAAGTAPTLNVPTGAAGGSYTFVGGAVGTSAVNVARNITIIAGPVTAGWAAAAATQGWAPGAATGNHWTGDAPTQGWAASPLET